MDWSKIKTIFILSFAVLNIFLFYEFFRGGHANQLDGLTASAVEQQLEANNILLKEALPDDGGPVPSVTGMSKVFTQEEVDQLSNQVVQLTADGTRIVSRFIEPIYVGSVEEGLNYQPFLSSVKFGDAYVFSGKDEGRNLIYFVQNVGGRRIFHNETSTIIATYNEANKIVSYEQMYLESLEEMKPDEEPTNILPALKALESLYVRNLLRPNSEVTSVELGYYRLVTIASGLEVFVPTWRFIINDRDVHFVNGIEGQVVTFAE